MAKCNVFPGVTVSITIDGADAPEIQDPDEIQVEHDDPDVVDYQASRTVSKYIEAKTGQHFAVRMIVGAPIVRPNTKQKMAYTKLGFKVFVDGNLVWKPYCERPHFKNGATSWEEIINGLKEGKGQKCTSKGFKFTKLETTDNTPGAAKFKRLADKMKRVGIIEIKVYRENCGKQGGDVATNSDGFVKENEKIPEKALKGASKSLGVALEAAKKTPRGKVWRADKIDGENYPLAIFRFIYREKNALQILGLIPRSLSPSFSRSPSISSSSMGLEPSLSELIQNMPPERQRKLAELIRSGSASNKGKANPKKTKTIKREQAENDEWLYQARKRQKGNKTEVIVIDDDDDEAEDSELFVSQE